MEQDFLAPIMASGRQSGVFIPIGNNGWLISANAPQYKPSFVLNKAIAQKAEHFGPDFLLSIIKPRSFGRKTEFWDYSLESFPLMAGLAAVTDRIRLFATAASLLPAHPGTGPTGQAG
nr:LLM class flavin-dependent oxidoreductase [Roseomonas sp. SXEYE001]